MGFCIRTVAPAGSCGRMASSCEAGTATSKTASGGANRTASAVERKLWPTLKSRASAAAFSGAGSAMAITGKPALAYAGRWAARTMPPAPMTTMGRGDRGRGG